MDYVMSFALHSNAFFCYDFIFIRTQYMIHDGGKKWIEKKLQQKI
jgi:hypothetical protein